MSDSSDRRGDGPGDPGAEAGLADDELLAQLRELFQRAEQVPSEVVAAAKDLYGLRTLDADLAELTWDSLLDQAPVAVRSGAGTAGARLLTFDALELSVEVEVLDDGAHRALTGQLVPAQRARIEVRQLEPADPAGPVGPQGPSADVGGGGPDGRARAEPVGAAGRLLTTSVDADELGRFAIEGLRPGPVSLTCHRPGLRTVTTDWIRIA